MMTEIKERDYDFYRSYMRFIKEHPDVKYWKKHNLIMRVINGGAPRIYISFETARIYIQYKKRNQYPPLVQSRIRRKMIDELYENYCALRMKYKEYSDYLVIEKTLEQPVSSFFIGEQTATNILRDLSSKLTTIEI